MYESLGIAMELDGRSKSEIERAVMSAADFSTSADELMYIAQYLSRLGLDRRAMLLYQQVAKIEPLRSEAYALGLRAAERCDDLAGIRWATVGILSQAWPTELAEIELTASRIAKATLEQLASEGRDGRARGISEAAAGSGRARLRRSRVVDGRRGHRRFGGGAGGHDLLGRRAAHRRRRRQARRRVRGGRQSRRRCRAKSTFARRALPASIACGFTACGAK